MRSRFVLVILMLTSIACSSKSTDHRDSAVPAADSSPGKDSQADVAIFDGPLPDVAVAEETSAKDMTSAKDIVGADLARDAAVPDMALASDGNTRDSGLEANPTETAAAKDAASEAGRDSVGSSVDGALAAFCTGDLTRSVVNGLSGAPAVKASSIPMDCCDGIGLELNSATFASAIYVKILIPATGSFPPAEVDLASLPKDTRVSVATGCDSAGSSCKDSYSSGFIGRLQMAWLDGGYGLDVSLCLHVEDTDGSHTSLRNFDLYIPHVVVK
jgi:hypothetical protein